ncbi:MAG: hypothetical protein U0031_14090 [Thermomicrobiales bacterium]
MRSLGISRERWYARLAPREPEAEAVALREAIERIVLEHPGCGCGA